MKKIIDRIVSWSEEQLLSSGQKGFVIGISGGVDSAVVSTLCARTHYPTLCLSMPIRQSPDQLARANEHIAWLRGQHTNVVGIAIDLTEVFETFRRSFPPRDTTELSMANLRSRIRMSALYNYANVNGYLVSGTGNAIEDVGIGFCTRFGDSAVDLSPIGDLTKTQVWAVAKYLGIPKSIQDAKPTDGLWADNRGDEDAIGASYPELEKAMAMCQAMGLETMAQQDFLKQNGWWPTLSDREKEVVRIYLTRHERNAHKMKMPPICRIIP